MRTFLSHTALLLIMTAHASSYGATNWCQQDYPVNYQ